jgi:hypothetical protein
LVSIFLLALILFFSATQDLGIVFYTHSDEDIEHNGTSISNKIMNLSCLFILFDQLYLVLVEHYITEEKKTEFIIDNFKFYVIKEFWL